MRLNWLRRAVIVLAITSISMESGLAQTPPGGCEPSLVFVNGVGRTYLQALDSLNTIHYLFYENKQYLFTTELFTTRPNVSTVRGEFASKTCLKQPFSERMSWTRPARLVPQFEVKWELVVAIRLLLIEF